jgi:cyclopropane-fatty-acyl-phospholipid synthase
MMDSTLLPPTEIMPTTLSPPYREIQAHYDLSNDFYRLFLGPTMVYSCAYFERDEMTLDEAQEAKIRLSLGKCELQPGMRLLDIGCGWGSTILRAVENYGVKGVGITLSPAQLEYDKQRAKHLDGQAEFRLQGWEEFDEPVDRILSIGAAEHFREERYGPLFEKCYRLLPAGAPLMVHSIVYPDWEAGMELKLVWTEEDIAFAKFIQRKIFPGGQLRSASVLCRYAKEAGFAVEKIQSLQPHYARTLDCWASALEANRDEAIKLTSPETYEMYMHYMTGCATRFHARKVDVVQLSFRKPK